MSSSQEETLAKLLIGNYNAETDNLNPIVNPNVKPVDLETILTHFKIDDKDIKMLTNPNDSELTNSNDYVEKKTW